MVRVLQTWDDGVVTDIGLAEVCRRHGAKATFCLNPGLHHDDRSFGWRRGDRDIWRLRRGELYEVYKDFEICSHSLTHPDLTALSPEALAWEIRESKRLLEEIFRRGVLGFAYPFNAADDNVREAVRVAGYRFARGVREQAEVIPSGSPWHDDFREFYPSCHFLAPDFWERYDRQRYENGVFFFWGHSYELDGEDGWREFEDRVRGISLDPQSRWSFFHELLP